MRSASLFGMGRFATVTTLAFGAGACAEGREPPAETAMVEIVKRNPSAIGWLTKATTDRQLRTLLVIKESR